MMGDLFKVEMTSILIITGTSFTQNWIQRLCERAGHVEIGEVGDDVKLESFDGVRGLEGQVHV
jgi:hypothetical protein